MEQASYLQENTLRNWSVTRNKNKQQQLGVVRKIIRALQKNCVDDVIKILEESKENKRAFEAQITLDSEQTTTTITRRQMASIE